MNAIQTEDARVVQYEFEVDIAAPQQRVWLALTDQISAWWLPDFHILGPDSIVSLEPHAGGRFYEQSKDHSLLWYTVIAISPGESLSLSGVCTPDFGGPCSTLLTVKLAAHKSGTRVTVSDALYGRVSEEQANSLQSGWQRLFGEGLKRFSEER